MLTPRQRELIIFIRDFIESHGYAPTLKQMIEGLGLVSKSGAFRMLESMEARGYIRRTVNRERAVEILRMPMDLADEPQAHAILQDLLKTYESGRFPTREQWEAAAHALGRRKVVARPQKAGRP